MGKRTIIVSGPVPARRCDSGKVVGGGGTHTWKMVGGREVVSRDQYRSIVAIDLWLVCVCRESTRPRRKPCGPSPTWPPEATSIR